MATLADPVKMNLERFRSDPQRLQHFYIWVSSKVKISIFRLLW